MLWPVALPQWLGAPAILLLGLAGIVLFGSLVLTYAFLANAQPAATPLVLELGFERALGTGPNPMAQSFAELYAGGYELRIPSLLLNTTVVDSGRRAIVSNIALDGFTDTLDLRAVGFSTRSIRVSAAAGTSARFTYVSPAGSLRGPGEHGDQKIRRDLTGGHGPGGAQARTERQGPRADQTAVGLSRPWAGRSPRPCGRPWPPPCGRAAGGLGAEVANLAAVWSGRTADYVPCGAR